jgi:hypothetical protein
MSLYRCNFCKDALAPTPPDRWQWLVLLMLIRPYSCPHCRESYLRPVLSLRNLFGRPTRTDRRSTSVKGWKARPGLIKAKQPPESGRESGQFISYLPSPPQAGRDSHHSKSHETTSNSGSRSTNRELSDGEGSRSSRRRKSSSDRSSRAERQARDLRRKDAMIASISGQSRPAQYRSSSFLGRTYRKLRRRARRLLGMSRHKKK